MSGIKSAIELAMERTRGLVLDEGEKHLLAARDMENKVRAVVRRYMEGIIERNGVDKELANINGDEKSKKSVLIDLLINELGIAGKNERPLDLLNSESIGLSVSFKRELAIMQEEFAGMLAKQEDILRKKISDRLGRMGITGSAVEPNVQEWDEWKEAVREADGAFRSRMAELKKRMYV